MAARIQVRLLDTDADDDELERSTAVLRAELLKLDVEDVTAVSAGPAPDGSRAPDLAAIGNLLVTVAQLPETLRQLVRAIRIWLPRSEVIHSVELTLDGDRLMVSGVSSESQERLIEAWLSAHAAERD